MMGDLPGHKELPANSERHEVMRRLVGDKDMRLLIKAAKPSTCLASLPFRALAGITKTSNRPTMRVCDRTPMCDSPTKPCSGERRKRGVIVSLSAEYDVVCSSALGIFLTVATPRKV